MDIITARAHAEAARLRAQAAYLREQNRLNHWQDRARHQTEARNERLYWAREAAKMKGEVGPDGTLGKCVGCKAALSEDAVTLTDCGFTPEQQGRWKGKKFCTHSCGFQTIMEKGN